jgi:cob(I)alamin adenosyltransferase
MRDDGMEKVKTSSQIEAGNEAHKRQAQKHKEVFEQKLKAATKEKGLIIVNTGTGKGKSTAAFGMGLRVLGHGMRLGVVQFIKGALFSAEREVLGGHENCEFHTIGDGYTWNTQDREKDIATAEKGWQTAVRLMRDPSFDMVILDELNVVLKHEYLDVDAVINEIRSKRPDLHVVITGRHAPQKLIDESDLVSEIKPVKHPYKEQGVKAQKGVEF